MLELFIAHLTSYKNFKAAPGITTLGNVINYDGIIIIMEL